MPIAPLATAQTTRDTILRGRQLVIDHACAVCQGGQSPYASLKWLAGMQIPSQEFQIGPCSIAKPDATPCFRTRPRNITPDNATGIGRFTERQIFNALRFGLRPGETPDVTITSMTPGEGNFPKHPRYLAPPMPWSSWRYMSDPDLWAIAAYLKRVPIRPRRSRRRSSRSPSRTSAREERGER